MRYRRRGCGLGKLGPNAESKSLLFNLLDPTNHPEVIAHAALALEGKLSSGDTPLLACTPTALFSTGSVLSASRGFAPTMLLALVVAL